MRVQSAHADLEQRQLCQEGGVSFGDSSLGCIGLEPFSRDDQCSCAAIVYAGAERRAALDGGVVPARCGAIVDADHGRVLVSGVVGHVCSGCRAGYRGCIDGLDVSESDILSCNGFSRVL